MKALFSHGHSTIHREHLPGDVAGFRTREEGDGRGDIFGISETAERDFSNNRVFHRLGKFIRHISGDEAGSDGVASDRAAGKLPGDRFGEADQARFAGRVVCLTRVADEADHRSDVNDPGVLRFHHGAHETFHGIESTFKIGIENGVPVFFLHAHEESVAGDPGVVHEDVHAAEFFLDLFREILHSFVIRNVYCVGRGHAGKLGVDFLRRFAATRSAAAYDCHFGSFRSECAGDFLANAAPSSSDDGYFVGKTGHAADWPRRWRTVKCVVGPVSGWIWIDHKKGVCELRRDYLGFP